MKSKKVLFIFFLALPILVFGRFMELFTMIDSSTGFFYDEYANFNIYLSAILIVISCIIILMSFLQKNYPKSPVKCSPILGIFSLIFSLALLINSANLVLNGSIFSISDSSGYASFSIGNLIYFVLIVLAAISFGLFAVQNFTGSVKGKFTMVFPVILWTYRLIYTFIGYTGIANISENVIEIFAIAACLIFLLAHGKLINNLDYQKNIRTATAFGIIAALLCGLSTIPRYILFFMQRTDLIHEGIYGNPLDFILCAYIICFLFVYLTEDKKEIHQ